MDAVTKLQELYELKKNTDAQIEKIEILLGAEPQEKKQRAPQKCGICGSEEHTKRNCPTRLSTIPYEKKPRANAGLSSYC
jgi:hypothetical protein